MEALIQNDAVVLGLLMLILMLVFQTSNSPKPIYANFYRYVPSLLLCYFVPSLLNITWFEGTSWAFRLVNGEESSLYGVASRYLLPASLVLLTLSIDFKAIRNLGSKALIMFFTATAGIIIGGPIAFWVVSMISPETTAGDTWRGLTTVAGSWIGGGANQTAMKEVFQVDEALFSAMIAIDVITANIWMAFLLYGTGMSERIDAWLKADNSAIKALQEKVAQYQMSIQRNPTLTDLMSITGVAFAVVAISHFCADLIAPAIEKYAPYLAKFSLTSGFFWIVVVATTLGLLLSMSRYRSLEGAGASKVGSLFLYVLVATIGLQMDITAIFNTPLLFLIGIVWMLVHITLLLMVAKLIRAPFFFVAIGSQANVGGAASAPIVASAFHPSLAPVGVLLAVLGYAVGTYGAWFCGMMLQFLAE